MQSGVSPEHHWVQPPKQVTRKERKRKGPTAGSPGVFSGAPSSPHHPPLPFLSDGNSLCGRREAEQRCTEPEEEEEEERIPAETENVAPGHPSPRLVPVPREVVP